MLGKETQVSVMGVCSGVVCQVDNADELKHSPFHFTENGQHHVSCSALAVDGLQVLFSASAARHIDSIDSKVDTMIRHGDRRYGL